MLSFGLLCSWENKMNEKKVEDLVAFVFSHMTTGVMVVRSKKGHDHLAIQSISQALMMACSCSVVLVDVDFVQNDHTLKQFFDITHYITDCVVIDSRDVPRLPIVIMVDDAVFAVQAEDFPAQHPKELFLQQYQMLQHIPSMTLWSMSI